MALAVTEPAASFADVVFFCNSGAEAMECAIKMARKFQAVSGRPERYRIVTFEGAFHGLIVLIVVVVTMLAFEELIVRFYRRLR